MVGVEMNMNNTAQTFSVGADKLKNASVEFGDLCIVCGQACGSSQILVKAWSGNLALFGELSSTLSFRVPVHTDSHGCATTFKRRWNIVAYGPLISDIGVILISAPLAFYSFFLYAGIGGTLLLFSQFFGAYLRSYYRIALRIRQRASGLSTRYVFEIENAKIARAFEQANRDLLVGQ